MLFDNWLPTLKWWELCQQRVKVTYRQSKEEATTYSWILLKLWNLQRSTPMYITLITNHSIKLWLLIRFFTSSKTFLLQQSDRVLFQRREGSVFLFLKTLTDRYPEKVSANVSFKFINHKYNCLATYKPQHPLTPDIFWVCLETRYPMYINGSIVQDNGPEAFVHYSKKEKCKQYPNSKGIMHFYFFNFSSRPAHLAFYLHQGTHLALFCTPLHIYQDYSSKQVLNVCRII